MNLITKAEAFENGMGVVTSNDDMVLRNELMLAMEDCGYSFATDRPESLEESEGVLEEAVKTYKRHLNVVFKIRKGSIRNELHPEATEWDYTNGQPIQAVKTIKYTERKEVNNMAAKIDRGLSKRTWIKPVTNIKEEVKVEAVVDKPVEVRVEPSVSDAASKLRDTVKKHGIKNHASILGNAAPSGAIRMAYNSVNAGANIGSYNNLWYRTLEGVEAVALENEGITPVANRDGEIYKHIVNFKEPVFGIKSVEIFNSKMDWLLYTVSIHIPGVGILKGFKVMEGKYGGLRLYSGSFKSGQDKDGKDKYFSHIEIQDKGGEYYEDSRGLVATVLVCVEALMDAQKEFAVTDEDDEE